MGLLIVFFILLIIALVSYIIYKLVNKKYTDYILKNSIALQNLLQINEKYHFFDCGNYDSTHTYDNNKFYNNISCQDYLIYQLQFQKYDVIKDIKSVVINRKRYDDYCKEVNSINSFGKFEDIESFNKNHLLSLEKKIFEKNKLDPITCFQITITLNCSKINGEIYETKHKTFNEEQISEIIKKLNDKNRDFYNDRDIWDAICRVERGKVSNKMRFSIYKRDGYRCRICGRSGLFDDLEIDHIKPIAKGGKTTYDNLQTLCKHCNKEKGDTY